VKRRSDDPQAKLVGIVFGWHQDQIGEHDLLGLLAQRVQPGDPGEVVLAGRVADLGARLRPQMQITVGWLLALSGRYERSGQYERPLAHCERGLALHRQAGNHGGVGDALYHTGKVHARRGDLDQARSCLEQAVDVFRDVEAALDEALCLTELGDVLASASSAADDAPREAWLAALLIFDGLSGRFAQAQAERVKHRLGWVTRHAEG
jgi:tetratricopeptide (TPR) repeat protein